MFLISPFNNWFTLSITSSSVSFSLVTPTLQWGNVRYPNKKKRRRRKGIEHCQRRCSSFTMLHIMKCTFSGILKAGYVLSHWVESGIGRGRRRIIALVFRAVAFLLKMECESLTRFWVGFRLLHERKARVGRSSAE